MKMKLYINSIVKIVFLELKTAPYAINLPFKALLLRIHKIIKNALLKNA
jgi:hypothetical protein